jgi:glycosyltransferase involved in cell wall biosynthesis
MVKVSIILPGYNHGRFLKQRIDSILNQTYQEFELIILDDKSQDNSRQIIEGYKSHPKISHIIFNNVNSGSTFKQWEKGINLSTGEYIWIAESDDSSDSSFLMKMVSLLDNHANAALAFSQSFYIDENNKINFSGLKGIGDIWKTNVYLTSEQALKQFTWHTQIVNASAVVFKKQIYNLIQTKHYTNFKFCGDWFFWIQLLEHGGLVYESKELNYFRGHSNNVRSINSVSSIEVLEQLEIYHYMKTNHKSLVSKNENKKFQERLKFRLYVKICQSLKGQKVAKLNTSIIKSLFYFPGLIILLPKLFALNFIKKFQNK